MGTDLENLLDNEQTTNTDAPSEPAPAIDAPSDEGSAPTGETAAPPAASVQAEDRGPLVPRRALEDERRKRQEYERRIQELEGFVSQQRQPVPQQQMMEPQGIPDPWSDPQGYAQYVQQAAAINAMRFAEEQIRNREYNRSEARARKQHGDEAVEQAFQAAVRTGTAQHFLNSEDPYGEMVEWFNQDRQALRDQVRAELEAEMGLSRPASPNAPAPAKSRAPVPRSLGSQANNQPRDQRGRFQGPTPLEDIIG